MRLKVRDKKLLHSSVPAPQTRRFLGFGKRLHKTERSENVVDKLLYQNVG